VSSEFAWWLRLPKSASREAVIALCKERGWLKARGRKPPDSTHILAKVRAEGVVETLGHTLNVLAVVTPDWGLRQVQPDWLEGYGPRESRISLPLGTDERKPLLDQVGRDGWNLRASIEADPASRLPALYPCS
jgi:hypothetical protein